MRVLNLRSGMSCALKVGDRTFGVISWVAGEDGRRFSEDDLAFGEDLAQRAAVAIDNAQLHSQVRTAALELQRAVLPDELPRCRGLVDHACSTCRPAAPTPAATSTTSSRSRTAGWRCSSAT